MNEEQAILATPKAQGAVASGEPLSLTRDVVGYFRQYVRQRPEVVALWCFGVGFVLGWKLKPW